MREGVLCTTRRRIGRSTNPNSNVDSQSTVDIGTPASVRDPPQRYVYEIELPAYLDPKSPFATKTVWGIGVLVNRSGNSIRRGDNVEKRFLGNEDRDREIKEEATDVDNDILNDVVSSAVERVISPPSNSPSRAGTIDSHRDGDSQRSISGALAHSSPNQDHANSLSPNPNPNPSFSKLSIRR